MLIAATIFNLVSAAEPTLIEDVTIMALGALDGRAVVKTSDGKMQVLKLGDIIAGTGAIVTQILNDKIIAEETVARTDGAASRQTVWISKPAKPGEKSQVQRFSTDEPPKDVRVETVLKPVEPKNQ